jgi:hypothetical protein
MSEMYSPYSPKSNTIVMSRNHAQQDYKLLPYRKAFSQQMRKQFLPRTAVVLYQSQGLFGDEWIAGRPRAITNPLGTWVLAGKI